MNKKVAIVLIILAVLVAGGIYVWQKYSLEKIACTQEAKQCPDGSYVGRIAPDCNFAPCSINEANISWQTYKNEKYGFEFQYPGDHTVFSEIKNKSLIPAVSDSATVALAEDEKNISNDQRNLLLIKIESQKISPQNWLAQMIKKGWYHENQNKLAEARQIAFQGKTALQLSTEGDIASPYKLIIVSETGDLMIIIEGSKSDILEKALSTFKFTFQ